MTVIPFPSQAVRQCEPEIACEPARDRSDDEPDLDEVCPFDETLAAALVVHNLIIEGIHDGSFFVARPAAALQHAIFGVFGPDSGPWAEFQFEAIYGTDPYQFLMKLLPYLETTGAHSA